MLCLEFSPLAAFDGHINQGTESSLENDSKKEIKRLKVSNFSNCFTVLAEASIENEILSQNLNLPETVQRSTRTCHVPSGWKVLHPFLWLNYRMKFCHSFSP